MQGRGLTNQLRIVGDKSILRHDDVHVLITDEKYNAYNEKGWLHFSNQPLMFYP